MSTVEVAVRHNFESGHRLPHLKGKCESLHGHSWWAEVVIAGDEVGQDGTLIEFGMLKRHVRSWVDDFWDHGLMLGREDPLVPILEPHGKVYVFEGWPSVEGVAAELAYAAMAILDEHAGPDVRVRRVDVTETHVNRASWVA